MFPSKSTLSALMTTIILTGCGQTEGKPAETSIRPAKLFVVEENLNSKVLTLPALVEASEQAIMTFQVPGLVTELDLKEGQTVQKGQQIARLDQRNFKNAVASAKAQFQQASSDLKRIQSLLEKNAVSQSVYEKHVTQKELARVALDSAEKQLSDSVLIAPYDATIAKVHLKKHENVSPQQGVVTLIQREKSKAVVQVPASVVLKSGFDFSESATLTLDAAPDTKIQAQFLEASATADPATQTYQVSFEFEAPADWRVLPGMTGNIISTLPQSELTNNHKHHIPMGSVVGNNGETWVWVFDNATETVTQRPVSVKPSQGDLVSVEGLNNGDTIVSVGAQYLFEGAQVRPLSF